MLLAVYLTKRSDHTTTPEQSPEKKNHRINHRSDEDNDNNNEDDDDDDVDTMMTSNVVAELRTVFMMTMLVHTYLNYYPTYGDASGTFCTMWLCCYVTCAYLVCVQVR